MTTQDHRVRKLCIIVGGDRLEPLPLLRTVRLKQLKQSRDEQATQLIYHPVAGEAAQVFLHCEKDESKGACIVIGAIPFPIIRHVENSMLENSRVIGHPKEVIEL